MHIPTSLVMMKTFILFYQTSGKNTSKIILSSGTCPELKSELLMFYSYFKFLLKITWVRLSMYYYSLTFHTIRTSEMI